MPPARHPLPPPAMESAAQSIDTGDLLDGPLAGPHPRHAWPQGVQADHPSEMAPLRCNPTERHSAATTGHRAAFNTAKGAPTTRPGVGLVPAPPQLAATLAHHYHPPAALSGRRSGGVSALLWAVGRGAHLGYRCRLVAAITAAACRPVKPPTQLPFDTTYGGAKRRAHRRRSLFGSTLSRAPSQRAWPPGGQPDQPPEMPPLRRGPSQGHRAATAGRSEAWATQIPPPRRPQPHLDPAPPPLATTGAYRGHPYSCTQRP